MKLFRKYLTPIFGGICAVLFTKFSSTLLELALPIVLAHIVDEVVLAGEMQLIFKWSIFMGCDPDIWDYKAADLL